jgi:hypothetical protein
VRAVPGGNQSSFNSMDLYAGQYVVAPAAVVEVIRTVQAQTIGEMIKTGRSQLVRSNPNLENSLPGPVRP